MQSTSEGTAGRAAATEPQAPPSLEDRATQWRRRFREVETTIIAALNTDSQQVTLSRSDVDAVLEALREAKMWIINLPNLERYSHALEALRGRSAKDSSNARVRTAANRLLGLPDRSNDHPQQYDEAEVVATYLCLSGQVPPPRTLEEQLRVVWCWQKATGKRSQRAISRRHRKPLDRISAVEAVTKIFGFLMSTACLEFLKQARKKRPADQHFKLPALKKR
jgi:hypothetical protein